MMSTNGIRVARTLVAGCMTLLLGGCIVGTDAPGTVSDVDLDVSAPASAGKGEAVTLTARLLGNGDLSAVVLQWHQTAGRAVVLSSATGSEVQFTAPSLDTSQMLGFRVDALLPDGTIVSRDVNVEVQAAADDGDEPNRPLVRIETNMGAFVVELYPDRAPITVANFLDYVDSGFYEGTIFHRVIADFVVQGGGFTPDLEEKTPRDPIENESTNGLKNDRGTISMAKRADDPDSGTSQFFINLVNNDSLNPSPGELGHAVFGRVIAGMEVVDAIAAVETESRNDLDDVPVEDVLVTEVRRLAPGEPLDAGIPAGDGTPDAPGRDGNDGINDGDGPVVVFP
jgi:cyclophilin family peptidyl-prolyl cis-trans isomerase